jgi:hypothetical protein
MTTAERPKDVVMRLPRIGRLLRIGAFVAVLTSSAVLLLPAAPANATAYGCTTTKLGLLCNSTEGPFFGGLHVDAIRSDLYSNKKGTTCNIEFNARGNGRPYSNTKLAKCGLGTVWVKAHPDRRFKDGSRICVRVRERGGEWQPYKACNRIHR